MVVFVERVDLVAVEVSTRMVSIPAWVLGGGLVTASAALVVVGIVLGRRARPEDPDRDQIG